MIFASAVKQYRGVNFYIVTLFMTKNQYSSFG